MQQTLLFFMQGVFESIGLLICSLALVRVELRWGLIFVSACIFAAIIYILRALPVTFGLHTIAGILVYALFISKATRVSPSTSIMAVFTICLILISLETITWRLFLILLNNEINNQLVTGIIKKLIILPQAIILITGGLLLSKYRKPMEGMWRI